MTEIEKRKKLLVAEAEVYRQLLKLEMRTLKICAVRAKRDARSFGTYTPLLMMALPLIKSIVSRRSKKPWWQRSGLGRLGGVGLLLWQAYGQLAPMLRSRQSSRREAEQEPSREAYLAERI